MSKQIIWNYFKEKGFTDCGIAGLMGNIQAESNFKSTNLQNNGNKALNMTDEQYTAAVDKGTYSRDMFQNDKYGFGLVQWTWHSRKAKLFDYAKKCKKSIGDLQMQLDFMYSELKGYPSVLKVLQTADTVREASDAVMLQYEKPADQSESARAKRASYGQDVYNEFCNAFKMVSVECCVLQKTAKGEAVRALQGILNAVGFNCGEADGSFGSKTDSAVKAFQKSNNLTADGVVGKKTWTVLLQGGN